MTNLATLRERVRGATVGSRELDWLIAEAIGGIIPTHEVTEFGSYNWHRRPGEFALWKPKGSDDREGMHLWQAPQVTTSLDSCLALVERLLPEASVEMWLDPDPPQTAGITLPDIRDMFTGGGATLPLAVLAALLSALMEAHNG